MHPIRPPEPSSIPQQSPAEASSLPRSSAAAPNPPMQPAQTASAQQSSPQPEPPPVPPPQHESGSPPEGSHAPAVPRPTRGISPLQQALGRRPRVLLAASGSVAAIKFHIVARGLVEWAELRAVSTRSALHFLDRPALPVEMPLFTDEDEWRRWSRLGDSVLHIELRKWADVMVIAPLSANTLAKMASGICDNLLTSVVRAWDFSKPLLLAPAMNTHMWTSPFTARHLAILEGLGAQLVSPVSKKLACGDVGTGAMAEPASIEAAIRAVVTAMRADKRVAVEAGPSKP
ncbi:hypothetical protein CLOM_g22430 [Closterium sp. NIES-68]|nr:hypothetical protein CLOM_g22430 [Closterium sp. NIES-68]GJP70226.1 hypothetical protein CLOP_g1191 [Closterium sp. NIES-67]